MQASFLKRLFNSKMSFLFMCNPIPFVNRAQDIIAKKWVVCKKNGMWTRENGKVLAGAEKYRYNG